MALVVADRVKETTTTTGTGTVTLLGASTGFQSFAAVGDGNTTYYTIAGQTGSEWEVGIGTYTSSGTTLSRTTVLSSSNGGSLVNFSAGTKDVFVTYPSSRSVYVDGTSVVPSNSALLAPSNVSDQANTSTGYFDIPAGTTAQRPGSPADGYMRFNTTLNAVECYSTTSSKWEILAYFTVPNAPTIGAATNTGVGTVSVAYTAPSNTDRRSNDSYSNGYRVYDCNCCIHSTGK